MIVARLRSQNIEASVRLAEKLENFILSNLLVS